MSTESVEILGQATEEHKSFKDRFKLTLSGLSGAYMLPIATLVLLAVFLSFGGFLESLVDHTHGIHKLGTLIKSFAYPFLQTIPLLFCVAFTMSFCKNDATCIWNSIIAYLVFIAVQGVFIRGHTGPSGQYDGYVILFEGAGRDPKLMNNLIDHSLGFTSMNTSVFGSFVVGGVIMPYIKKRWSNVQLKGPFAFFSGKRFIPLVAVLFSSIAAIYFLILWPWIGYAFSQLGYYLSQTPYGIDSLIFGILEKSLIPTGLHHMFYAPLWFSPLGGDAISRINEVINNASGDVLTIGANTATGHTVLSPDLWISLANIDRPGTSAKLIGSLWNGAHLPHSMWQGDSFLGLSIISMPSNTINGLPVFDFFKEKLGINVGRYTNGKFPIMQFCLPAAAVGMSIATDNPRQTLKAFVPGILSSALLGITEPIEFTFLFAAPALFYGFHAVMCGVSFMLMNILGAHIPSILSGGLVEMIIMGVIPVGKGTYFWNYIIVGMCLAPFYVGVFYYAVKYRGLKTPGMTNADEVEETAAAASTSKVPEQTRKLAKALGGWDNISKLSNCASRLRYDIVDKSKVDEEALKAAGVIAIKWVGENHLQAIVGPKAEGINNEMLKWKGEPL